MFFILSKVLYFLIKPIVWLALLLLYALFGKKPKWKKRSLKVGVLLFFLFSNHFLFNQVALLWEVKSLRATTTMPTYDIGILLGGYSNLNLSPSHDRHNFSDRGNRLTQTLELYYKGKIKKILLTGGSGRLLGYEASEAILVGAYLNDMGIPEEDIILEPDSRNTFENALNTSKIIRNQYNSSSCLLITSAWHMRRAEGCFNKTGLAVTPYCADYLGEIRHFAPESILLPDRKGFYHWEILIKEWLGYFFYWVKGYV